jgi:hypothetical protein
VTEPTIHPADQTAQRGTSPGKKCHYLVCHGEVQTGKIAFLDGAAVGVYTEIGDPLTWQDARNILKMRLDPIYRPVQGEFPEYKLSAFAQHERETWEKYAKVEFDAPDTEFLEEDQTLSSYLGVFSQSGHERELRLLACAGLSEPTSVARKAGLRAQRKSATLRATLREICSRTGIATTKQERAAQRRQGAPASRTPGWASRGPGGR